MKTEYPTLVCAVWRSYQEADEPQTLNKHFERFEFQENLINSIELKQKIIPKYWPKNGLKIK